MIYKIPISDFEGTGGFKLWLSHKGIETREGKGNYQVIQVYSGSKFGWQVIHRSEKTPEHLTINHKLIPLVKQFYEERKKCQN